MTPEWVFGVADAFFRAWPDSEGLMAFVWEGYLDESATDDGNGGGKVQTLSTLIAPSWMWRPFSHAWSGTMTACGAEGKILHMKQFLHSVPNDDPRFDWAGWTSAQKKNLLTKIIDLFDAFLMTGYCGSMLQSDYEELILPLADSDGPLTPYQLSLQGALENFLTYASDIPSFMRPSESNPVLFFMEQNQMLEADVMHQFFHLTRFRGWEKIFPSITPIPKGPAPLQAADVIAYEGSTYASRHVFGVTSREPRASFLRLKQRPMLAFAHAPRTLLEKYRKDLIGCRQVFSREEIARADATYEDAREQMHRARDKSRR